MSTPTYKQIEKRICGVLTHYVDGPMKRNVMLEAIMGFVYPLFDTVDSGEPKCAFVHRSGELCGYKMANHHAASAPGYEHPFTPAPDSSVPVSEKEVPSE